MHPFRKKEKFPRICDMPGIVPFLDSENGRYGPESAELLVLGEMELYTGY